MSSRAMKNLMALTVVFAATLAGGVASANRGYTGYSGKGGASETCSQCHAGGGSTVTINVPSTASANSTIPVSVSITSPSTYTSINIAYSEGFFATNPGSNVNIDFAGTLGEEITAKGGSQAGTTNGGNNTYTFMLKVPNKNGTFTVWASGRGNSVGANSSSKSFTVTGATAGGSTSTSSSGGTSSGSTSSSSSSGGDTDGGSASSSSSGSTGTDPSNPDDPTDPTTATRRRSSTVDDGGCAAARSRVPHDMAVGSFAVMAYLLAMRRRRRA